MKKKLLLLLSLFLIVKIGYSQTRQLSGTVTDSDSGTPLPGASVLIKGTTNGVATGTNGEFKISVTGANPVLVVTFIGFTTQEVTVGSRTQFDIKLLTSATQMEQVVVIGYSALPKKDITGAVTTLNAEKQLADIPNNSTEQALTGRLAGVQIQGSEGSLDADYKIVIRGGGSITQDNSPLYIVDGIQVDDGLRSLSPQDIERVDVLKDASATAIYGSRGANGVVIVTTKSGKAGTTTVNYNGLIGINMLPKSLPVMSPYEFVVYQYDRYRTSTSARTTFARRYNIQPTDGTTMDIPNFAELERFKEVKPVDWQREVMDNTGVMKTHNLSVSGGTKATKYNFSFTRNDQTGIVLNTDYIRNLFNVKLDQTVNDKFKLGFTLRYSSTNANGAGTSDPGNAQLNGLRNFIKYKPYLNDGEQVDEFDEEYFAATNQGGGLGLMNPVAATMAKYRKSDTEVINFGGNVNYNFDPNWSVRSTLGVNFTRLEVRSFRDALRTIDFPSVTFQNGMDKTMNQSNVLTYTNAKSKTAFARKNSITTLVGQEVYIAEGEDLYNSFTDFPKGIKPEAALNQLTQGTVRTGFPNKNSNRSTLMSFFGRGNYTYNDKYIAAVTLRADGSSKFAPGKRWGYFPSASLGWQISEENFMKSIDFVSDVKLRLSHGASGNNRIQDYAFLPVYEAEALYALNDNLNSYGYQSSNLPNAKLKWETTIQSNLGLDFAFMQNRFQGTVDVYSNKTNDVITRVDISGTSGYATQLQNTADTWNRGVELQLSGAVIKKSKFSWNADFNISSNKNTVEHLSNGLETMETASGWVSLGNYPDYLVQVGKSIGNIYGYLNDGFHTVDDFNYTPSTTLPGTGTYKLKEGLPDPLLFAFAQPGSIKIKDVSGNGIIGTEDKVIIGNAIPLFFGGLNQQFTLGNFDASVFVNYSYGNDILNANKVEFTNGYLDNNNLLKIMEGRWRNVDNEGNILQNYTGTGAATVVTGVEPERLREFNKDATIWQYIRSNGGYYTTDWAVEDGSFLRINNVTVGYSFNAAILSRVKIKRARIYATGNNLAIITNYSGYDPEVNTRRSTGLTPGVDYSAYPRNRGFVFGVNLSF